MTVSVMSELLAKRIEPIVQALANDRRGMPRRGGMVSPEGLVGNAAG